MVSREWLGECGNRNEFDAVGKETFEVFDVAGGDGLAGAKGRGGDHAIGMRTSLATGLVKKTRGELRLVLGEGMDAAAKDGVDGILLFLGVRTVAKLRPRHGGSGEGNLVFQPSMHHLHLRRMAGDEVDQKVGV